MNLSQKQHPTPGSADLCFMVEETLDKVIATLYQHNIPLELEPSTRTGACGKITSLYIRDPDNNLIERENYPQLDKTSINKSDLYLIVLHF
jgi:catechol 2,3-dioxygenase-like lactoylglutathione lyase family enzyme